MEKFTATLDIIVKTEKAHKNAPYTVDGLKHFNAGEIAEALFSYAEGYGFRKDGNTAFDKGSDVGNTSVKSARARLTTKRLATERLAFIDAYMDAEPSEDFAWIIWQALEEGTYITAYKMERHEFRAFAERFTAMTDGTPRFPINNKALLRWLEERAGA